MMLSMMVVMMVVVMIRTVIWIRMEMCVKWEDLME